MGQDGAPLSAVDDTAGVAGGQPALGTGDTAGALAAAQGWADGPAPGRPRNPAALAQLRIGAAIAHLAAGAVDGVAEQVAPVLDLAPEFRIATVTGWLADLDARLARSRYATSPLAADLRHQIHHFTMAGCRQARPPTVSPARSSGAVPRSNAGQTRSSMLMSRATGRRVGFAEHDLGVAAR